MAQSSSSGTSSRRHGRSDHDTASLTSSRYADAEWEAKEALRQRELEEARARATQMEKTMRWWSDCTANWREKWSKVRNERNKAREESKQLRIRLEAAMKDAGTCRRERQELETENERLRQELEQAHMLLLKGAGKSGSAWAPNSNLPGDDHEAEEYVLPRHTTELCHAGVVGRENAVDGDAQDPAAVSTGLSASDAALGDMDPTAALGPRDPAADGGEDLDRDHDCMLQKMSMLQLRLDEASKTIQIEREEKGALQRALDRLRGDLAGETRVQDGGIAGRLALLRAELERMQAENSAEWRRSESLETEKLALERENKKLRAELRDANERLERMQRNVAAGRLPLPSSSAVETELREDLADRVKELTELKQAHSKLKKVFQEKSTELAHAARRAEQYEAEVKRLRARVEEVKRELTAAEDEVDAASNSIRKLQRANDELQEQVETLQVQLEHLHSRFQVPSSSSSHRNGQDFAFRGELSDDEVIY
ncbi:coiled-coil domain-containing protein 102A-like [Schistocerca gregaria]|uniref:coiled-coil domain-containing protein 102A-like n=1 Tax=Schistocerca gregaria TaxID=7010 RepID=UPI00211DEAB1|nr:coiled-coil domain-containing protein 102A-like [Schistocerca gregaria]XP_049827262.1 coiled-coil domain-containing protein 102A-like [Schistocerca gregaria]